MRTRHQLNEGQGADEILLQEYEHFLSGKAEGTIDAYVRTTRHVMEWVAQRPGNARRFHPQQLTKTAVEVYLASLEREGFSLNHRARVKSTISSFARWLMEEKGLLQRNPTRGVDLPSQQMLAPRQLSEDQRYILRTLVEQENDRRGTALFALGYWAGCRVSDVSWLQMAHTHVGPKVGWVRIGYKGGKWRDIDLINEARKPLYEYLRASGDADRTYVFTSQRSGRSGVLSRACHEKRYACHSNNGTLHSGKPGAGEREAKICQRIGDQYLCYTVRPASKMLG